MKLSKKIVVAASVGALGVAAAVPAMALENEFSGIYNMRYYISNVDNGTAGAIVPSAMDKNIKANNYFEQRARLKYTAKANDDLKLVTHFELDSKFGGQGATNTYKGTANGNDSGQLDADSITLETKNVYLDFNLGKNINVKTGIQPVSDKFKGIFVSLADLAGVNTTTKIGNVDLNAGYFRMVDAMTIAGNAKTGTNNYDLALLDAQFNVNKNLNLGAAYYYASDYTNAGTTSNVVGATGATQVHTLGLYANAKVGALALSGFAAMQQGMGYNAVAAGSGGNIATAVGTQQKKSGYAANFGAKLPVGAGTLKAAYLFTSGDDRRDARDTSWFSIQKTATASVTSYNESGMMLLNRNLTNTIGTTDRELIFHMGGANGTGNSIISVGYDATITPKTFANVNAGMAFASKNQSSNFAGQRNGTNLMGTEVNLETGYKVYTNLTAKVQAAYVFLGGYYAGAAADYAGKRSMPENPYTTRVVLQYAF